MKAQAKSDKHWNFGTVGELSVKLLEEYLKQRENEVLEAKDGATAAVEHPSAEDLSAEGKEEESAGSGGPSVGAGAGPAATRR